MKGIQPQFASELTFVAVDIGYGDLKELHAFAQEEGYPWLVGVADRKILQAFDVKVQSTKIAIDADGVIVYRAGYGKGTSEEWISVFEKLSAVKPST
jgi:hypothetical protein